MKHFMLPCALALAGACASSAQPKKPTNPLGDSPQVAEAGRLLYNRTCTGCHGADGREGDRAPALDANRRYFRVSEAAIFDVVKNGIPGTVMPSSGLSDNDSWKIGGGALWLVGAADQDLGGVSAGGEPSMPPS